MIHFFPTIQVEDLKAKLASQEAQLTLKKQNIEALIAKIGLQTEKVSSKRKAADVEAQKVRCHSSLFRHQRALLGREQVLFPSHWLFLRFLCRLPSSRPKSQPDEKNARMTWPKLSRC